MRPTNISLDITLERQDMQNQQNLEERQLSLWLSYLELRFSAREIALLCELRERYQNGGSDREALVRRLNFMKYLIQHHLLES